MFFHNNAILSAPVKTTHKLLMNFFLKRGPTGRRKKVIERGVQKGKLISCIIKQHMV